MTATATAVVAIMMRMGFPSFGLAWHQKDLKYSALAGDVAGDVVRTCIRNAECRGVGHRGKLGRTKGRSESAPLHPRNTT